MNTPHSPPLTSTSSPRTETSRKAISYASAGSETPRRHARSVPVEFIEPRLLFHDEDSSFRGIFSSEEQDARGGKKKRAITSNLIFEQSNCKRRPAEYNSSCGQSNDIPPISVDQSTQNARFRGHLDLFSPIAKMGT
mmetsp:Transcript_7745/g.16581  ORF Transcript_7745/g.16581 Transcript_7745/m.16581 type:complete len:137 (+) Transcript_7745:412-822(+)|eukprot:CAMPEP_0171328018 /NCGR_PEP_ID=MMETSP0878-20121228/392_1 /TAXON_ID=67004 /ORGANISM="Thalassiosira weissflogii, Strain CCMP1336" /LENGTH=136 /DNA_ID=CAMNT_0011827837 /DNA_START=336 /DNA_END=746 /DNA_ORIENTATION=+